MNIPSWFTLNSDDTKHISITDLKKIHEIEQDMWAEWIWEYVKCSQCSQVFWKNDIFWHLERKIYQETVQQIEKIIWLESIKCKKCNSDTDFIWWDTYLNEIKARYYDKESFLTTLRSDSWEIIWFSDGYINDLETIYKREFELYYSNIWLEKIKEMIKEKLSWNLPKKFFMHSTTWIEKKYSTLKLLYSFCSLSISVLKIQSAGVLLT